MGKTSFVDLTGEKIGKLTVKERFLGDHKKYKKNAYWLCECECGNVCVKSLQSLKKVDKPNCGCVRKVKHGLLNHPLYSKWKGMKARCYNENDKFYYNYGGKGIRVYKDWRSDFRAFYNWSINNGWKEGLEIDRVDSDGDYCPDNCRFITKKQNSYNTKSYCGTSKYKGVYWSSQKKKWHAEIRVENKKIHLGFYDVENEAAMAYNSAAAEYFKEYAYLNVIEECAVND